MAAGRTGEEVEVDLEESGVQVAVGPQLGPEPLLFLPLGGAPSRKSPCTAHCSQKTPPPDPGLHLPEGMT